jgi:Spy/CpxP family protein refolding chaperone
MRNTVIAVLLLGTVLVGCMSAQQAAAPSTVSDQDIRLLRKDLRSTHKQIIAANLELTDSEAQTFWPLFDQYTAEQTKINDTKLAVIKDYAANYQTLTDNQAQALVKRSAEVDQSTLQLRMKYLPLVEKVLSGKKAARFFQLERRINALVDLQLASEIPLVEP